MMTHKQSTSTWHALSHVYGVPRGLDDAHAVECHGGTPSHDRNTTGCGAFDAGAPQDGLAPSPHVHARQMAPPHRPTLGCGEWRDESWVSRLQSATHFRYSRMPSAPYVRCTTHPHRHPTDQCPPSIPVSHSRLPLACVTSVDHPLHDSPCPSTWLTRQPSRLSSPPASTRAPEPDPPRTEQPTAASNGRKETRIVTMRRIVRSWLLSGRAGVTTSAAHPACRLMRSLPPSHP